MAFIRSLSLAGLILMLISVFYTLKDLQFKPRLIPDVDITKCGPLTDNKKRLWAYWHTGAENMPVFAQENVKMWSYLTPGWELRIIQGTDPSSACHYSKYVSSDMLSQYFDQGFVQLQSDGVRLALMRKYGGVYMDVTTILFEPLEKNFWNHVDKSPDDKDYKHLVGYYGAWYSLPGKNDGYEVWMLTAAANDPLMTTWQQLFFEVTNEAPKPFIRNETTRKLNDKFPGVTLDPLGEFWINYSVSCTCLHALLQMYPEMNEMYVNKSIIRDVSKDAFRLNLELDFSDEKIYNFFVKSPISFHNINRMIKGVPVHKLTTHARYFNNNNMHEWRKLDNLLGYSRIYIYEKAKEWRRTGIWVDS